MKKLFLAFVFSGLVMLAGCGSQNAPATNIINSENNICQLLYEVLGHPISFSCNIPNGCYIADPTYDMLIEAPRSECLS